MKVMMEKEVEDDAAERSLPQLQSRACKRTGELLFHVQRGGE
jgi:hypothetical protein